MWTHVIPAFAASLLLAGPALAAGAVEPTTTPPVTVAVAPTSTTDWTGFSLGAQLGYLDVETSGVADLEGDDITYGLRAYYDYDFGDFVVGGGLQYDKMDVDIGGVTDLETVLRVGARVGIDLDRNWLYGTAGYALAETSNALVGDSDGYFAGLGCEVFLTDVVTAGAEVLYHQFEDFDLNGLEAEATTVSLSVNYRF